MPCLTEEQLDDLLYYSRTANLSSLTSTLIDLSHHQSLPPSTIVTSAIDPDSGNTPLHYAAANGHLEVLSYLLDLLPDGSSFIDHKNASGNTVLHWASLNGRVECVKLLVGRGSEPGVVNKAGHDAVFQAEMCTDQEKGRECAEWMLKVGQGLERGVGGRGVVEGDGEEVVGNGVDKKEDGNGSSTTSTAVEKKVG